MDLPTAPQKHPPRPLGRVTTYFIGILSGTRRFPVLIVFLLFSIILAALPSYQLFTAGLPFINDFDAKVSLAVHELLPEDFKITIQNGQASTNVKEPYYITFSYETLNKVFNQEDDAGPISQYRLLAIDTDGTIEDFEQYQSFALLTSTHLVYYSDNNLQITNLDTVPDMTITREIVLEKINRVNHDYHLTDIARTLIYFSPILLLLGSFISLSLATLLFTFLSWIISKIVVLEISFGRLFPFTAALYTIGKLITFSVNNIPALDRYSLWLAVFIYMAIPTAAYQLLHMRKNQP